MDDSEIEKVIEKTLDTRRKNQVNKFFHNPNNAEGLCLIFFAIALGACLLLALELSDSDDSTLVDSLLGNLNCDSLKDMYKNSNLSWSQANQIKNHMLVQCL